MIPEHKTRPYPYFEAPPLVSPFLPSVKSAQNKEGLARKL
jgi:hypothetical protein